MAAPVFDSTAISAGVSTQANTLPISWTHASIGAGANNGALVAVVDTNNGASSFVPTGTPTADIGGTALSYLGSVLIGNQAVRGFIAVWGGLLVPAGTQTVTTSIASSGQTNGTAYGESFIYTGVGGFGTLHTAFATSSTPSVAVPSAAGDLVWGLLANWFTDTFSSFSLTSRQSHTGSAPLLIAGDGAGASSVTVSATQSSSREWGAVGVDIKPVVAGRNRIISQAVQAALR